MPRFEIDIDYLTDHLVRLLRTPSPTGNTGAAVVLAESAFDALGLPTEQTNKGAVLATLQGRSRSRPRALSGHVDTLGAMVKEIKVDGRLKLTALGGYLWQTVEGEYCTVETADGRCYTGTVLAHKTAVHTYGRDELASVKHTANDVEVRLDERTASAQETRDLGIEVGDFVSFDPRTTVTASGFVKSRHLDDKAGVAIMLAAAKALVDADLEPAQTTTFYVSPYEEVGHGAASGIPEEVRELLVVDMGALGDGQNSDEYTVSICAKDSSGPYDLHVRRKLVALCQEHDIPYKVDVYPYYGSDGSAALRAGADLVVGLIGPGVDASHAFERTHQDSLLHTARLAVTYLLAD
ncbi:MAG: M42 family metallopeptidase [Anaerolineae bacterium]|nr:M42 family metallopeptidase [Anaerolineae bacterium]